MPQPQAALGTILLDDVSPPGDPWRADAFFLAHGPDATGHSATKNVENRRSPRPRERLVSAQPSAVLGIQLFSMRKPAGL